MIPKKTSKKILIKDGKETIELSPSETGVVNEVKSNKVIDPSPFIENDPYTAVSPIWSD